MTKNKKRQKYVGKESVKFANMIKGNWNANKPLEIVVFDMNGPICLTHLTTKLLRVLLPVKLKTACHTTSVCTL